MSVLHLVLARKEPDGTIAQNVMTHRTGGLNIDSSRISTQDNLIGGAYAKDGKDRHDGYDNWRFKRKGDAGEYTQPTGRFPANIILNHSTLCQRVGTKEVKNMSGGVSGKEKSHTGDKNTHCYGKYERVGFQKYGNADGKEAVEDWHCSDGCPVGVLDMQSGITISQGGKHSGRKKTRQNVGEFGFERQEIKRPTDSGGASRFFKCLKYEE
jgi:hypothetical protein